MTATQPVPIIALIGGVGSGKSTLARRLAARHNVVVVDADAIGHRVLVMPEIQRQLRHRFGDAIFEENGQINRAALARRVFGSAPDRQRARRDLETIVHPEIGKQIRDRVEQARATEGVEAVILDAAVLLEAGWHSLCNAVVFVDVPEEQRFDRVAACRGWTEQEFGCREASQWPIPQKRQRADFVIPNSDHRIEEAGAALDRILRRLIEKNG